MMIRNEASEINLLPEKRPVRMTVHSTTKLSNRRKKICRFDSFGAVGLISFGIRAKL
jgi:hypothetical protein